MNDVPVALFAFRRADLLARTLQALRVNGVTTIHAFADGARDASNAADIAEVRRVLRQVDWADLRLVERPRNLGLDANVIAGVSDVLRAHDRVVVCEDDIEFAPGAYTYLCAALERYRDEPRVMCVNGWTHPRVTPADAREAPYFTGRFGGWGWGTWRRAWAGFPETPVADLRARCVAAGLDIAAYGEDVAAWTLPSVASVPWDMAFGLYMRLHRGLTLMPPVSMTSNIGKNDRASHAWDPTGWEDHPESPPLPADVRWPPVIENAESAALWRRAEEPVPRASLLRRIARRIRRIGGGAAKS